jgi:hypothetical protein
VVALVLYKVEGGGVGGQKVLSRPLADSFAVGRRQKCQKTRTQVREKPDLKHLHK